MKRFLANFNLIFSACLLVVFAYGAYESLSYMYLAKIFPLAISIVMFIAALINLIRGLRETLTASLLTVKSGGNRADLEAQWDIPMTDVWSKLLVYLAGILILYFFIWIIGYPLSITLFIILFYRHVTGTGWIGALIAGASGMGFLALVSKLLTMDWPEGLIQLPWPFG